MQTIKELTLIIFYLVLLCVALLLTPIFWLIDKRREMKFKSITCTDEIVPNFIKKHEELFFSHRHKNRVKHD